MEERQSDRGVGRAWRRWLLVALGTAVVSAGGVYLAAWKSPPYYRLDSGTRLARAPLSADEYSTIIDRHPRPMVVDIAGTSGRLVLFGADHTKKADDPQLVELGRRWADLHPTVALLEGRLGFHLGGVDRAVERYGEPAAVYALARRDGVRVYTLEVALEDEMKACVREHPAEAVALFYILRPYFGDLRHGRPADPDGFVEPTRSKRAAFVGMEGALVNMRAVDAAWRRHFPNGPDWRDVSDQFGLPGVMALVARTSNARRTERFGLIMAALALQGERVFAVVGSSHAAKLEAALRATIAGEPQ